MTVRVLLMSNLENFTWLPRRVVSTNPADNNLRLIIRKENSLGGTDLNLDRLDRRRHVGAGSFEV